ncbi:hypothetical protein MML48_9g00008917 [Holotrichia oblita]|uniref:Uncharacterized protein n=1 Tax=Holotrichia oblita TaxID=644536 RepID=A0ACB9SJH2_HOLOL|nr:hypothetical protein MML48_9g00008917 [Holotrichia oblita]
MGIADFGVEEAKQKIKSIRATYQQEQLKIIKSEKSGAGVEDVYKPNMKWFAAMHGVMNSGRLKRNTTSNMDCRTPANKDDTIEVDNENTFVEEDTQQSDFQKPVSCNSVNNEGTRSTKRAVDTPTSRRTRNKVSSVMTAIQELKSPNQTVNSVYTEDECDVFGRHIAMQLKKLPDDICIIA